MCLSDVVPAGLFSASRHTNRKENVDGEKKSCLESWMAVRNLRINILWTTDISGIVRQWVPCAKGRRVQRWSTKSPLRATKYEGFAASRGAIE